MKPAANASRSSKSARATACRTKRADRRTADKIAFIDLLTAAGQPRSKSRHSCRPSGCRRWRMPRKSSPASRENRACATPRWSPIAAGLERAMAAGVIEVAIFAAASETFSQRNINQSIDESLATYAEVCAQARPPASGCAGICRRALGVRSKAPVAPSQVAGSRRDCSTSACSRCRSATPSASRTRAGPRVLDAVTKVPLHRWRCTSTTPAAPPSPTCSPARLRRDDVRQFRRRPGRLPFRPGRGREPRDRRPALHAGWTRDRHRRIDRRIASESRFIETGSITGCRRASYRHQN